MEYLEQLYLQFLNNFPAFLHPVISIGLVIILVYSIVQALRRNFIYLVVLIVLLPAAIPILKYVFNILVSIIKFLLGK